MKPCPKCGRPMAEETMFRGLWTCPGYGVIVSDGYECEGVELTMEGAQGLEDECVRVWTDKHVKLN